jgi:putative nucleotidyltransferase with HDIG domain
MFTTLKKLLGKKEEPAAPAPVETAPVQPVDDQDLDGLVIEATMQADESSSLGSLPRTNAKSDPFLSLVRAGQHVVHLEREEDLLASILREAVDALSAQRGAIVLAVGTSGTLQLKAAAFRDECADHGSNFSARLARRCFSNGESILCRSSAEDSELCDAMSVRDGMMASVVCVPLRTPRKRLGVLHLDRGPFQPRFTRNDLRLADGLAAHVSVSIESAQLIHKQREMYLATVRMLSHVIEARDENTNSHTQRVTRFALLLGEHLGLSAEDLDVLRLGTPLHDIGKIGIDDVILRKPAPLSPAEQKIMRTHPQRGAEIVAQVRELASILPIVRSHHERWDGKGYPDGLAGKQIPRLARIVAVADAFDIMTSERPYRQPLAPADARAELERHSGTQFDPEVVAALLALELS